MGRGDYYRWNTKRTVEDGLTLSTKHLAAGLNRAQDEDGYSGPVQAGSLQWSKTSTGEVTNSIGYVIERRGRVVLVRFRYTTTRRSGEKIESDYRVPMTWTVPNYGGRRWWWICPLVKNGQVCGRRVGKLYCPNGALLFGCRHCYDLTYESTRQSEGDRIQDRLWTIRRRLGARGTLFDRCPDKPKWMHWETYARLADEYWRLWWADLREMNRRFGLGIELEEGDIARRAREIAAARLEDARLLAEWEAEQAEKRRRGTLGEIAKSAGVPYDFALEAQRYGLIRADGGRGTRRRRYRHKLSSWLEKLYLLNQVGYSWEDLQDWTRRRFQPGHEHERQWPAGFQEVSPGKPHQHDVLPETSSA